MLRLLFAALILVTGCSSAMDSSSTGDRGTDATTEPTSTATAGDEPTTDPTSSTTETNLDTSELTTEATTPEPVATLRTGAEVLADSGFASLRGLRVGAIVNQTSMVDDRRLIDLLAEQPDVQLIRLFAPEHGVDGSLAAGEYLDDSVDAATGVPIASLYGTTRQPTNEMFADLDVVLFDLQDVGSRSYTYISTMGLAMQTAAATDIEFVVLDRPNPLGGQAVGGFMLEPGFESFIGQYPLPNRHGMTVGEVALLIEREQWMPGLDGLRLRVIPIEGWTRSQNWYELDQNWIAPSPRLPTADSALLYNGMVLLAGTSISDGSGTPTPFSLAGAPWINAGGDLVAALRPAGLTGVRIEAAEFTPVAIEGVSPDPLHEGVALNGIRFVVADPSALDPIALAVEVLVAFQRLSPAGSSIIIDPASFDLVAGSNELRIRIERGDPAAEILESMAEPLARFLELRDSVLLYQ